MHKWLRDTRCFLRRVCSDRINMEGSRCERDMLYRCQHRLRKEKDSLIRVVRMGNLSWNGKDQRGMARNGDMPVPRGPRCRLRQSVWLLVAR